MASCDAAFPDTAPAAASPAGLRLLAFHSLAGIQAFPPLFGYVQPCTAHFVCKVVSFHTLGLTHRSSGSPSAPAEPFRAVMRNLCALVCFLMLTPPLHAACSGERHGQTSAAIFEISDGGCEYDEAMIQMRRFDEVGGTHLKPDLMLPFARDCRDTTFGFTCGRRKGNPLSGVTYRRTQDTPRVLARNEAKG